MIKGLVATLVVVAIMLLVLAIETWRERRQGMPGIDDRARAFLLLAVGGMVLLLALLLTRHANARDLGQWSDGDPAIRNWYQSLMQPDAPNTSCCGEADAYWADEIHVRDGKTYATITDDRDDAPRGRPHIDIGTEIEIPDHKLKWDRANPTGHGIVFMSRSRFVFCYVQPGGV